jgi:ATP-dependent DNA helicase RecQ
VQRAVKLAKWIDRDGLLAETTSNFGPALRLFGLKRFRYGQLPIILAALSGKSVLVVSPTGSGKTLCFQLPAVLRPGVALVVSPLKALMAEQVSDLLTKKIPATFITSDDSREAWNARIERTEQQLGRLGIPRAEGIIQAEIDALLRTPGADGCTLINGPVTEKICP